MGRDAASPATLPWPSPIPQSQEPESPPWQVQCYHHRSPAADLHLIARVPAHMIRGSSSRGGKNRVPFNVPWELQSCGTSPPGRGADLLGGSISLRHIRRAFPVASCTEPLRVHSVLVEPCLGQLQANIPRFWRMGCRAKIPRADPASCGIRTLGCTAQADTKACRVGVSRGFPTVQLTQQPS